MVAIHTRYLVHVWNPEASNASESGCSVVRLDLDDIEDIIVDDPASRRPRMATPSSEERRWSLWDLGEV